MPARTSYRIAAIFSVLLLILSRGLVAQTVTKPAIPDWLQKIPPRDWAVSASSAALLNLHDHSTYLRYRIHLIDAKGDKVRDVIESRDGNVARLVLRDGRPLLPEEDRAERERLKDMLNDPEGFAKHAKGDPSGKKIADQLLRLVPDAMLFTYVPGQPQTGRNPGMTEVVIDYEPNPQFHPPTATAEALTGLRGRAWIDSKSRQVLRMDGTIFKGINFGWGMLAHIYPDGKLTYEQAEAGNGRWFYTRFVERIKVRALMVKSLDTRTDIDTTDFRVVPAMSYQEAIQLLLDTPLPAK